MTSFAKAPPAAVMRRAPQRLSVTIPDVLFQWIHRQAVLEGRSASNLAAYLLEQAKDRTPQDSRVS